MGNHDCGWNPEVDKAGNLVHTVTATNHGPSDASNVTITDVMTPATGVSVDTVVPSVGTWD